MTPAELLAREILRLDSRGGRDTQDDHGFDPEAWPSEPAVRVALSIVAAHAQTERRLSGRAA